MRNQTKILDIDPSIASGVVSKGITNILRPYPIWQVSRNRYQKMQVLLNVNNSIRARSIYRSDTQQDIDRAFGPDSSVFV